MKKSINIFLLIILAFISFSCNQTMFPVIDPAQNLMNQPKSYHKVYVGFSTNLDDNNSNSKTLLPSAIDYTKFTKFELSGFVVSEPSGEHDDIPESEKSFSKTYHSYNEFIYDSLYIVATGWQFFLKAYMDIDGVETLVSDTNGYEWISYWNTEQKVTLQLNFNTVNNAELEVTVNIPYKGADDVRVTLETYYNGSFFEQAVIPVTIQDSGTEKSYFVINKTGLASGEMYVRMEFKKGGIVICKKLQYAVLAAFHKTKADITYTELNTPYTITYACGDDKTTPITWASSLLPSPDGYNKYQNVVLQKLDSTTASRAGFTLQEETWYEDYECTKPITGWAAGEKTGDIIVYSKWEKLPGVPLYVSSAGNNDNDGLTMETALKTFDAAWNKAAANPDYNAIYMVDDTNYEIKTNVNWDGAIPGARENIIIKRVCSESNASKTVAKPLFYLSSGCTTAIFSNLILDGGADWGPTGAVGYGLGLPGAEEGKIKSSMPLISGTVYCTLTLKSGCEIRNNHCSSTSNSGGIVLNGPSLVVDGAKIYNNYGGRGGGIYVYSISSQVTLKSGTIGGTKIFAGENKNECDGNFSTSGGGVYGYCGIPEGSTGQICYNVSSTAGAGIFMLNTDIINIQGGKIHNNYAMKNESGSYTAKPGAAISYSLSGSDPGDVEINNCEIYENYGESIIDCSYTPSGVSASGVVFKNTSIKNNYIYKTSGKGAIYQYNEGRIKIYDGTIVDNNYLTSDPVTRVNEGAARAYNSDNNNHSLYFYGNGYLGNYILKNKNTFYVSKNILNTPLPAGITHLAVIEETSSYKYNVGAQVLEPEDSAATAAMSEISKRFALKDTDYKIDSEGKKAYSTSVSGGVTCTVGFDKVLNFEVVTPSISRAAGGDFTISASVTTGAGTPVPISDFATEFENFQIAIKQFDVPTGSSSTDSNKVTLAAATISEWPTGNYEAYITGKYAGYDFSTTLHFTISN